MALTLGPDHHSLMITINSIAMNISPREYQIAELIAWGASDKEVALELNITPLTAKTHRRNIEHKINASNTADLTRWFFQTKHRVSFGLSPRTIKHIAMAMFFLVTLCEVAKIPVMRIRLKAQNELSQARIKVRSRRNENTLVLC